MRPTRRAVTFGLAAALAPWSARGEGGFTLTAAPVRRKLHPDAAGEAEAWRLGEEAAPVLRLPHGRALRVQFRNGLERPLALHWHGVRGPNAVDGVGGLTQEPVAPGASFEYRFTPPDPGVFLIRPVVLGASAEPQERGLVGALVVEEPDPPPAEADHVLIVDDLLLAEDGDFAPFDDVMRAATLGRLGNRLVVDGAPVPKRLEAPAGARLRLRLLNACNARLLGLRFEGLKVAVLGIDGQPAARFEPLHATLPFAPGTRYDLLVEAPDGAGRILAALGDGVELVAIGPAAGAAKPAPPLGRPVPNPRLPEAIRLEAATRRDLVIAGGAQRKGDAFVVEGDPRRLWTVNGASGSLDTPLLRVKRGTPVVLRIVNRTPAPQVLHVHGHAFRRLHAFDDGWEPYWLDTVVAPDARPVQIAFVADNPGRWLIASTVLERFDTGLWTWFEVS
ncbi:MAG TPA: multicopper oxidase family protein [Beijerinckiaceae bacterium]|nr:multicopper oxidase family protein [Beijerinckiaceae bacterium]